jgi:hypothetical protein
VADTVLQSFLVKLGFTVDPGGQKRFQDTMTGAARQVNELRLGLVALAIGVEEVVRRTTRSFDQLYASSRDIGVSARGLKETASGFDAVGLAADSARTTLNQIRQGLTGETKPVFDNIAASLKVTYTDAKTFFENTAEALGKEIRLHGEGAGTLAFSIKQMAAQAGINYEALRTVGLGWEFYRDRVKYVDDLFTKLFKNDKGIKDATEAAAKMHNEFGKVGDAIELGLARIVTDPAVSKAIDDIAAGLAKWLVSDATVDNIKSILDSIEKGLKDPETIKEISKALHDLGDVVLAVGQAVKWLIETIGVKGLAEIFGGYLAITFLGRLAAAFGAVSAAVGVLIARLPVLIGLYAAFKGSQLTPQELTPGAPEQQKRAEDIEKSFEGTSIGGFFKWLHDFDPFKGKGVFGAPHGQHGGIVPINAHAGEMLLPRQISEGLQQLFMRGPAYGGGAANDNYLADQLDRWLHGDSAFRPIVDLANQSFERLRQLFLDFFKPMEQQPAAPGGAPGGPAAPGGPGIVAGGGAFTGDKAEFIKKAWPLAQQVALQTGIDPHLVLAQAALESGWGQRATGQNFFGIKPGGTLAKYGSMEESFQAYADLMKTRNYSGVRAAQGIPAQIKAMIAAGYTPDVGYAEQLQQISGQLANVETTPGAVGADNAQWASSQANWARRTGALGTPEEAGRNLVSVKSKDGQTWRVNKAVAAGFQVLIDEFDRRGLKPISGGGYAPRPIRGSSEWSAHAFGSAIDIDPEANPLGGKGKMPDWVGPFARKLGLVWGGYWQGRPDPMHFEATAAAMRRGGTSAYADNSTTTINVHATDPHGTARAVSDQHDRRSASHMRNFRTHVA